ncbi:hypothetical protein Q058_01863 [Pseudomonas aeruginosa BL04]|nr:hypothetical protein Q058_01863 [Pseudomonas aeruginosa BL04]ERV99831.1 hypothetical protein Q039_01684 [Pseudomonas aeruginosa BWHPSA026]
MMKRLDDFETRESVSDAPSFDRLENTFGAVICPRLGVVEQIGPSRVLCDSYKVLKQAVALTFCPCTLNRSNQL